MAQYILKQDWLLMPIPDDVSYLHGAMACCGIGPSFGAMQSMDLSAFDTILITGLGPVGLGAIVNNSRAVSWKNPRGSFQHVLLLD